ncbi:MAG: HAD family hydrolase, partial [Dehalococcoidia bacterium]
MGRFDAIIFDMDGVLADSEPRYHRAINAVLAEEGLHLSDQEYAQLIGLGVEPTWQAIARRHGLKGSLSDYLRRYDQAVLREVRQPAQPNPGVVDLMAAARQRGLRLGLASSSLRSWIEALLEGIRLADAFDAVVSAGMVE